MRGDPMYGRAWPRTPSGSARADTLPMTDEEKAEVEARPRHPLGFAARNEAPKTRRSRKRK